MNRSIGLLTAAATIAIGGLLVSAQVNDLGRSLPPVTDAILQNPDPGDWLSWRRTLDGWGYSPLTQINKDNAGQLKLTWSRVLTPGVGEATPLVYNGVMFIPKPMSVSGGGGVQALDAATGDLLWEYRKELEEKPPFDGRMRSIAIFGDKIFLNTPDAHIVALNERTGKVVWDHVVANYKLGYRYTSGPIIVNGKVVSGMTGCDRFKNDVCFISAHDTETGKELWRTATIARPGEPGGDSWGDLPLLFRAGGDAWIPGSYDPKTNLIYWSVAQAKPWARISRGTDGAALYTDSLLALNPDTGKMVWHYQFIPGETHDMDEVFENILVDRGERRSLFKMGKLGILWEIDRTNGSFVAAHDLGYQNIVNLDTKTGKLTYRPGMIPTVGVPVDFCPSLGGVHTWRAMAYHPATHAVYIPITLSCQQSMFSEVKKVEGGGGNSVRPFAGEETVKTYPHPSSPDSRGQFLAMDVATGQILWRRATRRGPNTAALTTAGGLAIVGDGEPSLDIYDAETGKVLFQAPLAISPSGFPIAFAVKGKEFIAVPAGRDGPGISVFALPDGVQVPGAAPGR